MPAHWVLLLAASTNAALSTLQTPCTAAGSFCPGFPGQLALLTLTTFTSYTAAAGSDTASAVVRPCPAGTTNAASGTIIGACSDIAPNYELPAGTAFPTTNVLDIKPCATPATYCPGIRSALALQTAVLMAAVSAIPGTYTSSAMALACPAALSNAASGPSIAACADILPGFALPAAGGPYTQVSAVQVRIRYAYFTTRLRLSLPVRFPFCYSAA